MTQWARAAVQKLADVTAGALLSAGDRAGSQRCVQLFDYVGTLAETDARLAELEVLPSTYDYLPGKRALAAIDLGAQTGGPVDEWLTEVVAAMKDDAIDAAIAVSLNQGKAVMCETCGATDTRTPLVDEDLSSFWSCPECGHANGTWTGA